jgi:hypothetical protein
MFAIEPSVSETLVKSVSLLVILNSILELIV